MRVAPVDAANERELAVQGARPDQHRRAALPACARRSLPAMPAQLFQLFEASERRQFDSEGAYGSGGWALLAPITIQRKRALGLDNGILRATGQMADTLTDGKAAGAIRDVTPTRAVFGTEDPKAIFHQMGTSRMPRRRPVQLPERDRRDSVKIFQRAAFLGVEGATSRRP